MTRLTRKRIWSKDCQKAFETLKEVFTSTPILVHWDPDSKIIVETDASDQALAAILLIYLNGNIYSIAFYSRTFSDTELNYDVHDKDVIRALKRK